MNTPNTPDEIRRYADSIRIRSAHTDTAVLTGRLDGDAPSVVKARAFLDGFEAGLRAAASGDPDQVPDDILATLTPLPLGNTIFRLRDWQRKYQPLLIDNSEIGTCEICGAKSVEVRHTGAADQRVPQTVCADNGACLKGWVA
jgi:hypothetical protein